MDTKDTPASEEEPENPQNADPKSKEKDNDSEKGNSQKGEQSAKVSGEGNDAILIGRDVTGTVQNNRYEIHYHFEHGESKEKLQPQINRRKIRNKKPQTPRQTKNRDEKWLDTLDEYGKYYIVAVCFYYGIKVSDFREVLNKIKSHLSAGAKSAFSYKHPQVETIEKYDSESLALTIRLPDDKQVDQILSFIQDKHSDLLFNFIPILKEVVEIHPQNWEVRWRSAVALGQISEIDVAHVFKSVIEPWAKDERAYVRATVGYYFYYFFSAMEFLPEGAQQFILDKFSMWANTKGFQDNQWRCKWTVAAICEKIGLLDQEKAQKLASQHLEKVAGINHLRVADSVIHAFVDWSLKKKFVDVIALLTEWVGAGSAGEHDEDNPYQIRCVVALLAFSAIVEVNYDLLSEQENKDEYIFPVDVLRVIWDSQSGDRRLWCSLVSIGIRFFDFRMSPFFFEMVESWIEVVPDKDLFVDFVSSWVSEIYFNVRSRTRLENRVKNIWAKGKNVTLQMTAEMAQQKIKKGF